MDDVIGHTSLHTLQRNMAFLLCNLLNSSGLLFSSMKEQADIKMEKQDKSECIKLTPNYLH
jgi:hypothetical protein